MKRILTALWMVFLGVVPMFAYKDSVDYDNGNSGMGFLYFLIAWAVIAFIYHVGKKLFK